MMFDNFGEEYVEGDGARIFVRRGGTIGAPPLLLLHGYPQTSAMWHRVAPLLSDAFEIICPDIRGYGRSDKPATDDKHAPYSKRAMGNDFVAVMSKLGFDKFHIAAHDRGARVAHRLAMDHEKLVETMTLLDIAPTREMYANTNSKFAKAYWHWFFLIQKYPMPETIIGNDPDAYWKLKCFNQALGKNPFDEEALNEYLREFRNPDTIFASCEDYRAAATIDIEHDDADGDARMSVPLQVLWAKQGVIEKYFDAIKLWELRAQNVTGEALPGSHYFVEENPELIAEKIREFCVKKRMANVEVN